MIPSTHQAKKIYQLESDNNNLGLYNMIKEKAIKNPTLFWEGVRVAYKNCYT